MVGLCVECIDSSPSPELVLDHVAHRVGMRRRGMHGVTIPFLFLTVARQRRQIL